MNSMTRCLATASILVGSSLTSLLANGAGLGQHAYLEEQRVVASKQGGLTAKSSQHAFEELRKTPGAIGLVNAESYLDNFVQSLGDTLVFIPGVFADTSAQRENRVSIRGSGLNATFERRGLTVLRDGVPVSRASGITEFQEIDPLSIDYIEIFKGANGLRYGAASLGGAINIVTPTGITRPPGVALRAEGGSFDTFRESISASVKRGGSDFYGAVTKLNSSGFRDHAAVDSVYGFANAGFTLSERAATRFYLTALKDDFELAGSLSLESALNDPSASPSENIEHDQDRNLDVFRFSNLTVFDFDTARVETSLRHTSRKLDHAITQFVGIIDQRETEYGVSTDVSGALRVGQKTLEWVVGGRYAKSDNRARVFDYVNVSSPDKGMLTSEDDQDASNNIAYGQVDVELSDRLRLIVGAQHVSKKRSNENLFHIAGEDDSGVLRYTNGSVRLGLLYSISNEIQLYTNLNQAYEPPGIADITSGGAQPFTQLQAQGSITFELGSRGKWQ